MKLLFFGILSIMHFAKCTTLEDEAANAKQNLLASLNIQLKDPILNRFTCLNKGANKFDDAQLNVENTDSKKSFTASIEAINLAKKQTQAKDEEQIISTITANIKLIEQSYLTTTLDEKVVIISPTLKYYIFENREVEEIIYILLNQSHYEIHSKEALDSYLINKDILKTNSNEVLKHSFEIEPQKESIIRTQDQYTQANLQISSSQPYINLQDLFCAYDATLNEPDNLTLFVLSCTSNLILKLPVKTQTKVALGKEYFHHNNPFLNHHNLSFDEGDKPQGIKLADKKNYIIEQLLSAYAGSDITEVNETTEEHMIYIINNLSYNQLTKKSLTIEMKEYSEQNISLANEAQYNHIVREEKKRYPSNPPIKMPGLIIFNNKIFTFNKYFFFFIKYTYQNKYMLINQEETIIITF